MHGNRDFLFSEAFARAARASTLLDDPTLLDLYGTRTLLMHGDSLCTDDVGYQRYRACVAAAAEYQRLPRAAARRRAADRQRPEAREREGASRQRPPRSWT